MVLLLQLLHAVRMRLPMSKRCAIDVSVTCVACAKAW